MKYLLDTNTISDLYNKNSENHTRLSQKQKGLSDERSIYQDLKKFYPTLQFENWSES